jgi:hypothetical protein
MLHGVSPAKAFTKMLALAFLWLTAYRVRETGMI